MLTTPPETGSFVRHYLAMLPRHLDSYPECQAGVDLAKGILQRCPNLANHPRTSTIVKRFLATPLPSSGTIPEVHCMLLMMALRDTYEPSDEALISGAENHAENLFSGPIMKPLIGVLSPSLVLLGVSHYWSKLHQGSNFSTTKMGKNHCVARLEFPANLFNELMLKCFCAVWKCGITRSRAQTCTFSLIKFDSGSATFEGFWT